MATRFDRIGVLASRLCQSGGVKSLGERCSIDNTHHNNYSYTIAEIGAAEGRSKERSSSGPDCSLELRKFSHLATYLVEASS